MPTPEERREALHRVLQSSHFRSTGRLSDFLRFAVESTLNGNSAALKESVIGVEVFGRPADYDPRTDPVVRVEARRLRAKLLEYYHEEGAQDPFRIQIPKGGYTPTFVSAQQPAPNRRLWIVAAAVAAAALASAALLYQTSRRPLDVAIVAVPNSPAIAASLSEALVEELARTGSLRVQGWSARNETPNARSVVEITAAPEGPLWRFTGHMMSARANQKQWVRSYYVANSDWPARRQELAQSMAKEIRERLAR